MRNLSDTIARLKAMRALAVLPEPASTRLIPLDDFGTNPGALKAHVYLPEALPPSAPLVVVLHGCTQTAAGYDLGSGWSDMADRYGFALLFPEQQRQNNPNVCFNWFSPKDSRRDSGEALSIRQMIAEASARYSIDPGRVFVTGLSAGGAMASVMLATYPELFAGGAIIAGLPFGCAATVPEAFDQMRGHGGPGEADLAARVRAASDHAGPWPTVSVWHGTGDATVSPSNAGAIIKQWRALHGADAAPSSIQSVDGQTRRVWRNSDGREVIEEYMIPGMAHGTPLHTVGENGCGRSGAYMLEAGISSTFHICRFWHLAERGAPRDASVVARNGTRDLQPVGEARPLDGTQLVEETRMARQASRSSSRTEPLGNDRAWGVTSAGAAIEKALRAAGLMR